MLLISFSNYLSKEYLEGFFKNMRIIIKKIE